VVELWEPRADAVAQVGLLGDETGTIKFTKWSKSDLPELEEGKSYALRNVVTDEYQGRFSVKLNRTTTIEELDEHSRVGGRPLVRVKGLSGRHPVGLGAHQALSRGRLYPRPPERPL
jgi:hypothetical protein